MNLKECYQIIQGNYEDLLTRLGGSEALASKFVKKFVSDPSYEQLVEAVDNKDWESAFVASHTLKGVAANLSMSSLYNISSSICEDVRGNKPLEDLGKMTALKDLYQLHIDTIKNLD